MKIKRIELFKTPLDTEYKNVIDIVDTNNNINNYSNLLFYILTEIYDNKVLTFDTPRGLTVTEDISSVTVPYEQISIRSYNYCVAFDVDDNKYYFFIVGTESLNDTPLKSSSSLTLKWDSWANNIDVLMRSKSINQINCRHYDRYVLEKDYSTSYEEKKVRFKYLYQIQDECPHTIENISVDRYIPAFYRVQMTDVIDPTTKKPENLYNAITKTYLTDVHDEIMPATVELTYSPIDSTCGVYNSNFIYIFAGLFDTQTEEYINCKVKSNTDMYIGNLGYIITNNLGGFDIEGLIDLNVSNKYFTEYVQSVELTFNSPFNYSISTINNVINISFGNQLLNTDIGLIMLGTVGVYAGDTFVGISSSFKTGFRDKSNFIIRTDEEERNYCDIRQNFTPFNSRPVEPAFYQAPFNYKIICFNETQIPLNPIGERSVRYKIDYNYRTFLPNFKLSYNDLFDGNYIFSRVNNPVNSSLNTNGYFTVGKRAEFSYLVRNGSQMETAKQLKEVSNGISLIGSVGKLFGLASMETPNNILGGMGNISNVLSGATEIASSIHDIVSTEQTYNAKLKDLAETPSVLNVSSGEGDILYQDRLMIRQYKYIDSLYIKGVKSSLYLYGYPIQNADDVFKNYRETFDYVRTDSCKLKISGISNRDRITLENAFNRGIFKWHIVTPRSGDQNEYYFSLGKEQSIDVIPNGDLNFYIDNEYYDYSHS